MENIEILGLSLTAIILASNTLTNLFKFIVPETSRYRSEMVRLMNFGFTMLLTGIIFATVDVESSAVIGAVITIIGALGAEKVYDSNKSKTEGEDFDEEHICLG